MKTKKFAFVFLALALSIGAFATKTPKMNIVTVDDSKAIVSAVTDSRFSTEISIVSEDGTIVYSKNTKGAAGFRSVFDFSKLADGKYKVKLKNGSVTVKSDLEVAKGKVVANPTKTEFEPYFSYNNNMLKVSFLNFDCKDISLLVFNNSKLVFKTKLGNDFNIQRAFDVSKMVEGNFEFVLTGTDEEYYYYVTR